jgi:hypothetical protein
MNASLPGPRFRTSAFLVDNYVYVFGGYSPDGFLDEIVEYNILTDKIKTISAKLPSPRATRAGATVDGQYYLFGGDAQESELNEILVFNYFVGEIDTENCRNEYVITPIQIGVIAGILLLPILIIYFSKRSRKKIINK